MNEDLVAIIVVNWNSWRHTLACLKSLEQNTTASYHVFLIDNASSDDSIDHLVDLGDRVELIRSSTNEGWSGGNNIGIKRALEKKHEFIFLLNNDALIQGDAVECLMRVHRMTAGKAPVLGCLQKTDDGTAYSFVSAHTDASLGVPIWLAPDRHADALQCSLIPTVFVSGAALFAHRSVFVSVGLIDERFFLNFDETDWCFRASAAGHAIFTVRDAVVLHSGSATIGGHHSPMQYYFLTRNQLLFAEKHASFVQRCRVLRKSFGLMKWLSGRGRSFDRLGRVFKPEPTMRGVQLGVRDYLLRRFGNCPLEVRALNSLDRERLAMRAQ